MERNVRDLLNLYNPNDPLDHAWTIPSPWYFDPGIHELEQQSVFAKTWQVVGRAHQTLDKGSFFTADLADEPIVVARGDDGQLRASTTFAGITRPRWSPNRKAARSSSAAPITAGLMATMAR